MIYYSKYNGFSYTNINQHNRVDRQTKEEEQ